VGREYWGHAVDFDYLVSAGTIAARDRRLYVYADTASAIWSAILGWYRRAGRPL
jgi:predicted Rossmann-fold nucleotide-binding protein